MNFLHQTFYETVGVEVVELGAGRAHLRVADVSGLGNREGWVHGGALAGLLDAALTQATGDLVGRGGGTANLSVSFLEPARSGPLDVRGTVVAVHERRIEARAEASAGGTVVAVATAMIARGKR